MQSITISKYHDVSSALADPNLAQSLYDEGAVIMKDVLLTLHGEAHRARRLLEFRVFGRGFFRYYENEVFPPTLAKTLAPFSREGRADLVDLGYRVTLNLTADFAGIDREGTAEETARLLRLVMTFSEGATLVHSTRDKEEVRTEVRAALVEFERDFVAKSLARRQEILTCFDAGEIEETDLPRDVLMVLVRNEDKLNLSDEDVLREMAFYLQAGSHSTSNSTIHAIDDILNWCDKHPDDRARLETDPLYLQRFAHESFRLHPASPVAWRRPLCPVSLQGGHEADEGDRVIIDLWTANRDPEIFGDDADQFNPARVLPKGVLPFGLSFGTGVHSCLGRDLDGGVLPREDTDPATHQLGLVTLFLRALLDREVRRDPENPPQQSTKTERPNWGSYPILMEKTE